MSEYINREERQALRNGKKYFGMRAMPSEWDELQKDKMAFGRIVKEGIDVARLSDDKYLELVKSCKQTKLVI